MKHQSDSAFQTSQTNCIGMLFPHLLMENCIIYCLNVYVYNYAEDDTVWCWQSDNT